jgi:hypothetical protein
MFENPGPVNFEVPLPFGEVSDGELDFVRGRETSTSYPSSDLPLPLDCSGDGLRTGFFAGV